MEQHRCFVGDLEVVVLHPLCVLAQLQQEVYLLAGPGPGHLVAVVTHEHDHGAGRQPRLLQPRQHTAHLFFLMNLRFICARHAAFILNIPKQPKS